MNLREKLCEPFGGLWKRIADELEKIADDHAIEFAEWCKENNSGLVNNETLEIFKNEKINISTIIPDSRI